MGTSAVKYGILDITAEGCAHARACESPSKPGCGVSVGVVSTSTVRKGWFEHQNSQFTSTYRDKSRNKDQLNRSCHCSLVP